MRKQQAIDQFPGLTFYFLVLSKTAQYLNFQLEGQILGRLIGTADGNELWTPAVLLPVQDAEFGAEHVKKAFEDFDRQDDVFSDDFTATLILRSDQNINIDDVAARLVESGSFRNIYSNELIDDSLPLAPGPYFIQGKSLHQAWKLYEDDFDAFVIPTILDDVFNPKRSANLTLYSVLPFYTNPLLQSDSAYFKRSQIMALSEALLSQVGFIRVQPKKNLLPASVSTGAGAALAGYPWLDHSIGSDTSGSIRLPAAWNGLFGLRTSYGVTSRRGIVPSCNEFDTVGTLHRSLKDAKHLITATLDVPDSSEFPKRLLYPLDFFPQADAEQQGTCKAFIAIVERFLSVERIPISIADTWASNPPQEAGKKLLQEYLEMSAVWPMYYDTYHTFDDFRQDYLAKFGKEAFVGPYMRKRCETLTNAIMIMPFGAATPKYRDDTNKLPSIFGSFSVFYLPGVLQLPQLIIPVGQKPYNSRISGLKEYMPIVSSFMGAKDSDVMLINLAEAVLKNAEWPTEVQTGREAFEVGNNLCNVLQQCC
ncbi:2b413a13-dc52-4ba4-a058-9d09563205e3 [Sclerotinia trifoliorum]|uniref:2b413a13-dc52-4ba4-a058-9d09563205e3 n=1 Tax=Sclerotinia trifoliorum TaxID=28548 RepID=A0A8H2ZM54_9HELO|nr:2b413a13-dc52-4ba4-a058-9d09563205e3 [Sclerotinia trifoliorum]